VTSSPSYQAFFRAASSGDFSINYKGKPEAFFGKEAKDRGLCSLVYTRAAPSIRNMGQLSKRRA